MRSVKRDVRMLSQRLAAAERQNGILPLLGFRNNALRNEFQLVFAMPSSMGSPQTLGSLYGSAKTRPPLNTRINICGQLAEAVLQTHMLGLVHKSIQPENVLLFSFPHETEENESFPASYLCGWHYARSFDAGVTRLVGESRWQRAIYQHPERQSEHVEDEYCMGHDIYSLGVCMLEVLLWDPLVTTGEHDLQETSISRSYRTIFDQYEQSQGIQEETADMERLVRDPNAVQRTLVRMNKALVPAAAGIRMRDVVSQCLMYLDGEDILGCFKVSQEREDKDVAVGFVDTVLKDILRVMSAV
jgi:serine/threonine protein kinase